MDRHLSIYGVKSSSLVISQRRHLSTESTIHLDLQTVPGRQQSLSPSLCLYVCVPVYVSLLRCLFVSVPALLCLSVFVCLSVCFYVSLCLFLYLSASLSLSLCLFLFHCLSVSVVIESSFLKVSILSQYQTTIDLILSHVIPQIPPYKPQNRLLIEFGFWSNGDFTYNSIDLGNRLYQSIEIAVCDFSVQFL